MMTAIGTLSQGLELSFGERVRNAETRNPKHQIRNKSKIEMFKCSKRDTQEIEERYSHACLDHWGLFRVSDSVFCRRVMDGDDNPA
jgi:hypothetical protein